MPCYTGVKLRLLSPECKREYQRDAMRRRRSRMTDGERRGSDLKNRYGITIQDYENMMSVQDGRCAICRRPERRKDGYGLAVDHDHETGRVRGLLCQRCNTALGKLDDSVLLLERAAAYLKENS